jgi:hypothetical protein
MKQLDLPGNDWLLGKTDELRRDFDNEIVANRRRIITLVLGRHEYGHSRLNGADGTPSAIAIAA